MRWLSLFNFCAILLTTALATSPHTYTSTTQLTVYPEHPTQLAGTSATETRLKTLCGDENVTRDPPASNTDGLPFHAWKVMVMNDRNLTGIISGFEGVRLVKEDHIRRPSPPLLRRNDVGIYRALANQSVDIRKTEDFLKSKIQSGTTLYQAWGGDDIVGWRNLFLDVEAKKAVEEHEGIEAVIVGGEKTVAFGVLPATDPMRLFNSTDKDDRKSATLSRRADATWIKQYDADNALFQDSAYPYDDDHSHI